MLHLLNAVNLTPSFTAQTLKQKLLHDLDTAVLHLLRGSLQSPGEMVGALHSQGKRSYLSIYQASTRLPFVSRKGLEKASLEKQGLCVFVKAKLQSDLSHLVPELINSGSLLCKHCRCFSVKLQTLACLGLLLRFVHFLTIATIHIHQC